MLGARRHFAGPNFVDVGFPPDVSGKPDLHLVEGNRVSRPFLIRGLGFGRDSEVRKLARTNGLAA